MDYKSPPIKKDICEVVEQINIAEIDSILKLVLSRLSENKTLYNLLQKQHPLKRPLTHKEALGLYFREVKKTLTFETASEKEKRDFLCWIFEQNCRILNITPKDILTFYRNLVAQQSP